ncbi:hypothetical protein LCGC14_0679280 [marine sediment metagenome]|uniref:Peptide deformylase n=1 Tax=marine sediment metagenome TaxID=412755 RepID=A0A0F9QNQ3_9ZZZZ|nr:MAG: Peptide deformylase [Candidatus Lokiarchaeum sp. GC14_75]
MVIKDVLLLGNPKLRENSVDEIDFNENLNKNLKDLKDTLTYLQDTKKIGRAIAAPQIGILKKMIYFQLPNKSFYMINPKITWKSEEIMDVWDSCFCFDVAFFVELQRHKKIRVDYQDIKENWNTEEFFDDLSELVQHEVDHLHGVLATDYLKDGKKIVMRSEWERRLR